MGVLKGMDDHAFVEGRLPLIELRSTVFVHLLLRPLSLIPTRFVPLLRRPPRENETFIVNGFDIQSPLWYYDVMTPKCPGVINDPFDCSPARRYS